MNDIYMKLAINEAKQGIFLHEGGPFGCVIVKNGELISFAHNQVLLNNDPTAHGEIMAIRKACEALGTYDLSGCELYTTSEPCPMCKGAIQWANISKVYYGCTIDDAETLGFRDRTFTGSFVPQECMMKDECRELFNLYTELDHTIY